MVVIPLLIASTKKSNIVDFGTSLNSVNKNQHPQQKKTEKLSVHSMRLFDLIYPHAMPPKPTFFPTPAHFRTWLEAHHDKFRELIVGFHKKASGKPSITWPESVEAALCFGWIDGVRKSLDENSYTIRFTPRKPTSTWSSININLVRKLTKQGLMHPAGLKAFAARDEKKSAIYSYEQRKSARFTREQKKQFCANKTAWEFFRAQAPWYQRVTTYWVISAKREETRRKRLSELINHSQRQRRIPRLIPTKK
jgi:uncharacterized protein YdeI (YjbR/CyaY-like superfamily)